MSRLRAIALMVLDGDGRGLVCLQAGDIVAKGPHSFKAFWYEKTSFTFSDAIAAIRNRLWLDCILLRSSADRERPENLPPGTAGKLVCGLFDEGGLPMVPPRKVKRMIETLCYAAKLYKVELREHRGWETRIVSTSRTQKPVRSSN